MAAQPARKTCDACRRRKTKCSATIAPEEEIRAPCANCTRLGVLCTFDYVHKRGGRPLGSRDKTARKRFRRKGSDGRSSEDPTLQQHSPQTARHHDGPENSTDALGLAFADPLATYAHTQEGNYALNDTSVSITSAPLNYHTQLPPLPILSTSPESQVFINPPTTANSTQPHTLPPPHVKHILPAPHELVNGSLKNNVFSPHSEGSSSTHPVNGQDTSAEARSAAKAQAHWRMSPNSNRLPRPSERFYTSLKAPDLEIEDVTDWSTITFFASLYLKYNHALSPIVHKPTFAHDLATRRDKHDRQFRSFLLGLITYTIGQSPINRMNTDYTRRELEIIQDRCHRASLLLHDHTYRSPELNTVGTLIYAYFHCQCNSDYTRAAVILASACELAQMMKLDDTSFSSDLARDFLERELRKRVYWYLYAIDITSACAGLPVHMVPSSTTTNSPTSFPLEVDDELITTQGAFTQPTSKVSTMTGFVAMVRLHIVTGEALARRRFTSAGVPLSPSNELPSAVQWIATAENRIDDIQAGLPYQLAPVQAWQQSTSEEERSLYGMQRANILITALAAKFVLYDYKQDLYPNDLATIERRDAVAREGVQTITSIPQDDLASNGESMRGKVFRILLALMSRSISDGVWGRTLQEWWDLYMNIQFVSIASADITSVLPSRDPTPAL